MLITEFTTQQGRGQLQSLRRTLAMAVTGSIGTAAKVTWLSTVLGEAIIIVTADGTIGKTDLTQDIASNNTTPQLINKLVKAASESVTYGGDYKTQLIQDLNDADAILTA